MNSGTFLDSVRFRRHLGHEIAISPRYVSANVLGEHGTSAVLHWSAVTIGGVPLARAIELGAPMSSASAPAVSPLRRTRVVRILRVGALRVEQRIPAACGSLGGVGQPHRCPGGGWHLDAGATGASSATRRRKASSVNG